MRLENRLLWMEEKLHSQHMSQAGEDAGPSVDGQSIDAADSQTNANLAILGDQASPPALVISSASEARAASGPSFDPSAGSGGHISSREQAVMTHEHPESQILDCNDHGSASDPASEAETDLPPVDVSLLPEELLQVLIDQFYSHIYPIFPIFRETDLQQHLDKRASFQEDNDGFLLLLHALLAVSATILPPDDRLFDRPTVRVYKSVDLGTLLYLHARKTCSPRLDEEKETSNINLVVAQGLLSLYLAEARRVNEAWVTAGHAIRLYQGLDHDELTSVVEGSDMMRSTQGNLWRCLYILDRSLSTVPPVSEIYCDSQSSC